MSLVVSLLITGSAAAEPWPAPIRTIEEKGVTIVKQFDAPGGMTGYAARAGSRPISLYLTPDGDHVIVGTLLDADGKNLSKPQLEAAITLPDRENAWPLLEKASWIGDGDDDAPRKIYVFTDPNCPYCHKFYEAARPWVEAGKVQLRHIPVGILKQTSPGKAAALLAADDPEKAMARHEHNYRSGGITPMEDIPSALQQKVAANNLLMSDLGIQGTPGIFYKNDDNKIQVKQGIPQGKLLDRVMGPK
ncbi:thiol:disulfide interchange protein DsbG [Salinisphaera aquimarina]